MQSPNNPLSYDRYAYVWNNPINAIDPSGFRMIGRPNPKKPSLGQQIIVTAATAAAASTGNYWAVFMIQYGNGAYNGNSLSRSLGNGAKAAFLSYAGAKAGSIGGGVGWGAQASLGITVALASGENGWHALASAMASPAGCSGCAVFSITVSGALSEQAGGSFKDGASLAFVSWAVSSAISYNAKQSHASSSRGDKTPFYEYNIESMMASECSHPAQTCGGAYAQKGFKSHLGCRDTAGGAAYHCYGMATKDGEIYKQYSLTMPDGEFLPQDSDHETFLADRKAFQSGSGKIFEIAPPRGVTQKEFASSVIQHAEGYRLTPAITSRVYWLLFSNSNAAAGYPFLRAGGTLPSRSEVGFAPGLWDYEPMTRANSISTPSLP